MQALRTSVYPTMKDEPLTVVMRDVDIRDDLTIEQARDEQLNGPGPAFVANDIFRVADDTSIEDATLFAMTRMERVSEREANQAVLYHYAAHICSKLTESGLYGAPDPAPLTTDEVEDALRQLAKHPEYGNGMTVMIPAEDGTMVTLKNGEVSRDPA